MDAIAWGAYALAVLLCLQIAREDFKAREIRWLWFAVFGGLGIFRGLWLWGMDYPLLYFPSLLIIGLILALVVFVFKLRGNKQVMDRLLGWGDVAMLVAISLWLEPLAFLLFYITSLLLFVIYYLILQKLNKIKKNYSIPLAGLLALSFIVYFILHCFYLKNLFTWYTI